MKLIVTLSAFENKLILDNRNCAPIFQSGGDFRTAGDVENTVGI